MAEKKTKKGDVKSKTQRTPIPKKIKPTKIIALVIGLVGSLMIFSELFIAFVYSVFYFHWFFVTINIVSGVLMLIGSVIMILNRMTTMGARLVLAAALLEVLVGGGPLYLGTILGLVSGAVAIYSEK